MIHPNTCSICIRIVWLIRGAATSIVLNIAEGAGEFSRDEKRRFYRIARRSATEAAAILHIVQRRRHADEQRTREARDLLARVVSMLVRMPKTAPP